MNALPEHASPSWMTLLFAGRAKIEAAPAADRDAYFRFVEALAGNPEAFGFTAAPDIDQFLKDEAVDNELAREADEWQRR